MLDRVPIFTIGYGAREIDAFIAALQQQHIEFLIDVRSRPYSRYKPDFSRDALEGHLRRAGIRYVFLGDSLGGRPADPTCYDADGKVDLTRVAAMGYSQGVGAAITVALAWALAHALIVIYALRIISSAIDA